MRRNTRQSVALDLRRKLDLTTGEWGTATIRASPLRQSPTVRGSAIRLEQATGPHCCAIAVVVRPNCASLPLSGLAANTDRSLLV